MVDSHTEFPDEEGTEIVYVYHCLIWIKTRHTEFPDEEGTEIIGNPLLDGEKMWSHRIPR